MHVVFVIGTAGSGKSLFTANFSLFLKSKGINVACLNLDPGVENLPYTPDVDVRAYVDVFQLMEEYKLGPNGALVAACDLIAMQIDELNREVDELAPEYLIVDTPGQMELFAFRASGPLIASELKGEQKAILYLFDAVFSNNPLSFVSNMFLSAAVYVRFAIPQLNLLSKVDMLSPERVEKILDWATGVPRLEAEIAQQLSGESYLLSKDLLRLINRIGLNFSLIPVSSTDLTGYVDVHAQLQRLFAREEEESEQ